MKEKYDYDFYAQRDKETRHSAHKILGIIKDYINVSSVVDVGGGIGTWLSVAQEIFEGSSEKNLLLEGDYIDKNLLQIDEKRYIPWNLEEKIRIDQKFDLAISLEVAEHLRECRARSFCEDLTLLSNVILFSAAIPYQGGTGHINEQPISYWVDKFSVFNYEAFDIIRPLIQSDKNIKFWYRQNIMVFVKKESHEYEQFISKKKNLPPLDMVSFDVYMNMQKKIRALPVFKLYQFLKRIK